jgi:cyanophycinase
VHCAQWAILPRLLSALPGVPGGRGLALDEDTAVHLADGAGRVAGLGTAWRLDRSGTATTVTALRAGDPVG